MSPRALGTLRLHPHRDPKQQAYFLKAITPEMVQLSSPVRMCRILKIQMGYRRRLKPPAEEKLCANYLSGNSFLVYSISFIMKCIPHCIDTLVMGSLLFIVSKLLYSAPTLGKSEGIYIYYIMAQDVPCSLIYKSACLETCLCSSQPYFRCVRVCL